jgi:hypothetical protein
MADEHEGRQSELDRMREAAIARAAERIVLTLVAQGVEQIRALEFVEQHVELKIGPALRAYATCGDFRARGSSDEHLAWFGREIHLAHSELGGTPVPFGTDPGPPYQGETEAAARSAAAYEAHEAARKRAESARTAQAAQHTVDAAAAAMEQGADPSRVF